MHRVLTTQLQPGMKLARTIMNTNNQILLPVGTILTNRYIHKLIKLEIPAVYIDHGFLPDFEVKDVITDHTRYSAVALTKYIFKDFQYLQASNNLNKIEKVISQIIEELLDNRNIMVNLADIRSTNEYTYGHCVNTCVLAVITAINLGYNPKQIHGLAMGAILHDLGKIMVPQQIINKPGKLTNDEFDQIKEHAQLGYQMLTGKNTIGETSKQALLYHHERYDGSGYPHGLKNQQIPEYAAIVGIADMYDALTADRVYRAAFPAHEAYEMIAASGNYLFDYRLVSSFLHYIMAYPVGCLVQLNTGEICVVVKNRPGFSLRPVVKVLFNKSGAAVLKTWEIDLATTRTTTITKVITDQDEINLISYASQTSVLD